MEQEQVFKSKASWQFWAVMIALLIIFTLCALGPDGSNRIFEIITIVLTILLFSYTWFVRYVVNGDTLILYGLFRKTQIPISAITSVSPLHKGNGASASSQHKLIIRYNKYDEIRVTPKDPEAFVAALKAVNPQIVTEN